MSARESSMPESVHDRPSEGRRRVVVLNVRPEIDAGRWPIKRVLGEPVVVEADITADGHDVLRGVLTYRHEKANTWSELPLTPLPNDVWSASFVPSELGRWCYAIEAWVDAFSTWRRGLERKVSAGQDVSVELLEGAAIVEAAAARAAGEEDAEALRAAAGELRAGTPVDVRVALATDDELAARMARVPDRSHASRYPSELGVVVERPLARFGAWYEMFPRSCGPEGRHGTFRDAEERLEYIAEMGFDIVYLPPIHPIGQSFRKGRNNSPEAQPGEPGSPWAIGAAEGGHTSVHPELGTIDDFDRFVQRANAIGIELAIDLALQASPEHPWVREHPEWFRRRPDGTIQYAENPPKKYQDVYPFDFECDDWQPLWEALRGIVLFWIEHGVHVFRVDNPHTKPIAFWAWCIETVQARHPQVIFLAEAFTRPKLMYALAKAGFSQSYTYFTWRTTKSQLTEYLTDLTQTDIIEFFRPNFWPTTPDILPEHLQHGGRPAFIARLVLAATLVSSYGIYGPSFELMEHVARSGAEELVDNEKYQLRAWDIDRVDSLRHVIARVNRIRRENPALCDNRSLRFHATSNDVVLCYSKRSADGTNVLVMIVNLDPHHAHSAWIELDLAELGIGAEETFQAHDLLGDARYLWHGSRNYVELAPGVMPAHVLRIHRFVRTENMFEYFL